MVCVQDGSAARQKIGCCPGDANQFLVPHVEIASDNKCPRQSYSHLAQKHISALAEEAQPEGDLEPDLVKTAAWRDIASAHRSLSGPPTDGLTPRFRSPES